MIFSFLDPLGFEPTTLKFITKTCLCNFDPLKPHFYIVKLGFTGVYIIFLISAQNLDCGYSLELPRRGGSNEYPQSRFWAKIRKISDFLSENFLFLVVKFSVYTVDSRYLDPSYLDPITYVELISKSRLFSLCIYCISASRMSNYFYVDTSAISSIIFSPWIHFSQFLLPRISNSDHEEGKKNVRCGAAGLSVNENHNRPLINKSIL